MLLGIDDMVWRALPANSPVYDGRRSGYWPQGSGSVHRRIPATRPPGSATRRPVFRPLWPAWTAVLGQSAVLFGSAESPWIWRDTIGNLSSRPCWIAVFSWLVKISIAFLTAKRTNIKTISSLLLLRNHYPKRHDHEIQILLPVFVAKFFPTTFTRSCMFSSCIITDYSRYFWITVWKCDKGFFTAVWASHVSYCHNGHSVPLPLIIMHNK